jgi:hypothetical protein
MTKAEVFWVVTLSSRVIDSRRFREKYHLHNQGQWRSEVFWRTGTIYTMTAPNTNFELKQLQCFIEVPFFSLKV